MKIRSILAPCAALLVLSTAAARATTITFTIDSLNTLQVTGATATITAISPGDWSVQLSGPSIYSSLSLEFASPDYGGDVYLTTPQGGGPINVLVSNTAPGGFVFNDCGSNEDAAVADGTTCGIGYSFPSYATVYGTVQEVASVAATPEPSNLFLFGTGMLGLGGALRRRYS